MTIEFDHLFIFTSVGAPAVDQLVEFGLSEGQPNVHPGQGTACRRIFFHNAMLEFLWVSDEKEVRGHLIAPTRLWERSRYRQSGYSPFGLCVRPVSTSQTEPCQLPFDTWAYKPPYLPEHLQIDVARNEAHPAEPMLFCIPFGGRPDRFPAERAQQLIHPIGFGEISGLKITSPNLAPKSAALKAVEQSGFIAFVTGSEHLVEVAFDHASRGKLADFRPNLPLLFHW